MFCRVVFGVVVFVICRCLFDLEWCFLLFSVLLFDYFLGSVTGLFGGLCCFNLVFCWLDFDGFDDGMWFAYEFCGVRFEITVIMFALLDGLFWLSFVT